MNTDIDKKYYPMMVPEADGRADSRELFLQRWAEFDALSKEEQDIITSPHLPRYLMALEEKGTIPATSVSAVSRLIRTTFLKRKPSHYFAQELGNLINISKGDALSMLRFLKRSDDRDRNQKESRSTLGKGLQNIPLTTILQEESLATNVVTSKRLIFKDSRLPLTPTIANWIKLYEKTLGVGKHTAIQRGEFLYQSPLCKDLPPAERGRLQELLGAYDEGGTLTVDTQTKRIAWSRQNFSAKKLGSHADQDHADKSTAPQKSAEVSQKPSVKMSRMRPVREIAQRGTQKNISSQHIGESQPLRETPPRNIAKPVSKKSRERIMPQRSTQKPREQRPQQAPQPQRPSRPQPESRSPHEPSRPHFGGRSVPGRPALSLASLEKPSTPNTQAASVPQRQSFKGQPMVRERITRTTPQDVEGMIGKPIPSATEPGRNSDAPVEGGKMSFSSGQTMPSEKQ